MFDPIAILQDQCEAIVAKLRGRGYANASARWRIGAGPVAPAMRFPWLAVEAEDNAAGRAYSTFRGPNAFADALTWVRALPMYVPPPDPLKALAAVAAADSLDAARAIAQTALGLATPVKVV